MQFKMHFTESDMRIATQAEFNAINEYVDVSFSDLQKIAEYKDVDPFTGDYEVTPKVDAQTIPTAQKFMAEDMVIKAIPYYDVSNTSGGTTVYIAKEI